MQALFDFVSHKDTSLVAKYLKEDISLHQRDALGWPPIYYAFLNLDDPMIRLLKKHGADLSIRNDAGFTMLSSACLSGHERVVRLLLKHGADPNQCNWDGRVPLHFALIRDPLDGSNLAETLLKRGAHPNSIGDSGLSPLHYAVLFQDVAAAKTLLSYGAEVNLPNGDSETPLFTATRKHHRRMILLLLKHGANPAYRNNTGLSPTDVASKDIRQLFAQCNGTKEALQDTLMAELKNDRADPVYLDLLIHKLTQAGKHPENLNFTREDDLGMACTPLHMAVLSTAHPLILRSLIAANPSLLNLADPEYGWTPLHIAAMHQKTNMVKFLILAGADYRQKDLHPAAPKSYADYIRDPKTLCEIHQLCAQQNGLWNTLLENAQRYLDAFHTGFLQTRGI